MQTHAHDTDREGRRALLEQRRSAVAYQLRRLAIELTDLDRQLDEIEQWEDRSGSDQYSYASTVLGDGNTATVTGDNSSAGADPGSNNTATVTGDNSTAMAGPGDRQTATATDGQTVTAP